MKIELIPILAISNNHRRMKAPRRSSHRNYPGSANRFHEGCAEEGFPALPAYTPVSFHISGGTIKEQLQFILNKVLNFITGK